MIHEMEQDKDWYCVVWYDKQNIMQEKNFADESECKVFLREKRIMGFSVTAYYNTELSWALNW